MSISYAYCFIIAHLFNNYICILYFRGNTAPFVPWSLSNGFVGPPAAVLHLLSSFLQTFPVTDIRAFTPQVCTCKLGMRCVESSRVQFPALPWHPMLTQEEREGSGDLWGQKHCFTPPPNPSVMLSTTNVSTLFGMSLALKRNIKAISICCSVKHKRSGLLVISPGGWLTRCGLGWSLILAPAQLPPGATGALPELIPIEYDNRTELYL